MRQLILQTCVPPYRVPLFDLLAERLGSGLRVAAGERFFDPTIKSASLGRDWYLACRNRFLAGERLLWQQGLPSLAGVEDLVVEGNPRVLSSWLYLLRARLCGIRTAVWSHAFGRGQTRLGLQRKLLYALADAIVCYSFEGARMLALECPGKEILVAGNSNLLARDCRVIEGQAEDRNCVLFLGRLVTEKRIQLLLKALCVLQSRGQRVGARVLGDGPEKTAAEEFVRHQGLEDVQFLGYVGSQDEIRAVASCCFGLVCPGTAGLALTQAQSLGLPFIFCSEENNGPETEIAKLGFNCLGFELGNDESLAKQVGEMHGQRALWLSRSDEFVRVIAAGYTIEAMVKNFAEFFQRRRKQH
jgi:glycosyltransferase involved in cell wall biosynthesis